MIIDWSPRKLELEPCDPSFLQRGNLKDIFKIRDHFELKYQEEEHKYNAKKLDELWDLYRQYPFVDESVIFDLANQFAKSKINNLLDIRAKSSFARTIREVSRKERIPIDFLKDHLEDLLKHDVFVKVRAYLD